MENRLVFKPALEIALHGAGLHNVGCYVFGKPQNKILWHILRLRVADLIQLQKINILVGIFCLRC